jgi:membrane protein implicated in regulation of membrane protease activity
VVVEVGSGAWWFTLVLAITIAVRLVWALRAYRKRDDDDRETP